MLAKLKLLVKPMLIPVLAFDLLPGRLSAEGAAPQETYEIQPGDVLSVSVWKEETLTKDVIVRPDGQITFPLVGEARAAGDTLEHLRQVIAERLTKYIPGSVITVSIQQLTGNIVYDHRQGY